MRLCERAVRTVTVAGPCSAAATCSAGAPHPVPSHTESGGGGERGRTPAPAPWLLGPRSSELRPTRVRRLFLEAEGGGQEAPWDVVVPAHMLEAVASATTTAGRREASDVIAQRIAGQSLAQGTLESYSSVLGMYERFCESEGRDMDSVEAVGAWLAGKLARHEIVASTARGYLKTLSAVFSRAADVRMRVLQPGLAQDVVQSAERLMGARAQDVHEAVVYEEVRTTVTMLDEAGYVDLGTMFLVGWNVAARLSNILDTRICDVQGCATRLFVAPPTKMDRKRLRDEPVLLSDPEACERLIELVQRRAMAVGGPAGYGQRIWLYEPRQVMRILHQVGGPITTARAMRRGWISAVLATPITPEEGATVSRHRDMPIMRRYSDRVPLSEEMTMRLATEAARGVTREMLPRRAGGVRGLPTMWLTV